jgi:hypothetical protein
MINLPKIYTSLINYESRIKYNFNQKYKKVDYHTTYFEGGLGSQILNLIEHENKKSLNDNLALTDTSYFNLNKTFSHENGLTHWQYRLDHYGIQLEDLRSRDRLTVDTVSNLRRPNSQEYICNVIKRNLWKIPNNASELFPVISSRNQREKVFFQTKKVRRYGVLHIRKGDYIKVSSKLYSVKNLVSYLRKFHLVIPGTLVIVSDGKISQMEHTLIRDSFKDYRKRKFIVFDSTNSNFDETIIHDLMREADFLFTSNSTFSLTAGLLNTRAENFIITPMRFHSGDASFSNQLFQTYSEFSILK